MTQSANSLRLAAFLGVFSLLLFGCFCCGGCNEKKREPLAESEERHNLESLSKWLNIPSGTYKVCWKSFNMPMHINPPKQRGGLPGPTDWGIVALISLKPDSHEQLISRCSILQNEVHYSLAESLVTEEFKIALGDILSYDIKAKVYALDSEKGYEPTPLFRSPLLHGVLIPLKDRNQVFIIIYNI